MARKKLTVTRKLPSGKTKTMFGKPRYSYLSEMISLRNPSSARGSVRELKKEFDDADTSAKKLRIARATQLAANRAGATRKRKGLSRIEKGEYGQISDIYNKAAKVLFRKYQKA